MSTQEELDAFAKEALTQSIEHGSVEYWINKYREEAKTIKEYESASMMLMAAAHIMYKDGEYNSMAEVFEGFADEFKRQDEEKNSHISNTY